ncbi:preprotein translocase, SecG subunit [Orientia chuto str. Dubai]|uniref:Protein-export membrane protein SecG n=1 Tax=Orientia chuto str. Dubai TaxID=1359168 RepID=A0A0F3MPG8_9RICK|nr:preprotein translocase subunit SecG [Candidatus Orientia mediorientalis]KJV57546.1 preprotein translocase, SecG subunit [Orientia chuto str. Dubai]
MMNILLFIHIVISILLVTAILLHKTGADSLSGLSSRSDSMGIVTPKSTNSFLTQVIIVLATCFFINAIILANLSSSKNIILTDKLQSQNTVPLAK